MPRATLGWGLVNAEGVSELNGQFANAFDVYEGGFLGVVAKRPDIGKPQMLSDQRNMELAIPNMGLEQRIMELAQPIWDWNDGFWS